MSAFSTLLKGYMLSYRTYFGWRQSIYAT